MIERNEVTALVQKAASVQLEAMEVVTCHLCGGTPQRISTIGQHGLPSNVVICRTCGLVYLNPRWSKTRYQKFYASEYNEYYRSSKTGIDVFYRKWIAAIRQRLKQATSRQEFSTILDIGSGDGFMLDGLKNDYGAVNLMCIESSLAEQQLLQQKGYTLIAEDVDSDWHINRANAFDLVIMRHVLEHFLDPVEVLRKVASVLKPDGLLYLAVPDMMQPRGDLTGYWFRVVHTYYFSETTLRRTCTQAQLEPIVPVMHESGEMAAVLQRNETFQTDHLHSVYPQQLAVIRYAQFRTPFIRVRNFARQMVRSIKRGLSRLKRLFTRQTQVS